MTKKTIGIIGCGWLGFPLAQSLLKKGFLIKGSTTSEEKRKELDDAGIQAFQLLLSETGIEGEIDAFLDGLSVLIINIPPRLRGPHKESYVAKISQLIEKIEKQGIEKVIFASSTSVYANSDISIDETTIPLPETESGKQLLEVEKLLIHSSYFKETIIRFGGLIGNNRHPIRQLSGKKNLKNPDAPVNLIHLNDCIGIIEKIIKNNIWETLINAVYPYHPSKKEYYTDKAKAMDLEAPQFDSTVASKGKKVTSKKLGILFDYTFSTKI